MIEDAVRSPNYFLRRLKLVRDDNSISIVSEDEFLALEGPKIVLGEPGMGKTELMQQASRHFNVESVSAVRFMHSQRPEQFIAMGRPLLIDGLDEAMAKKDGDAVEKILAQLQDSGSPDFILTCRAREWQARSYTNLRKLYETPVNVATLEPLSRTEAKEFLLARFPDIDSEHVLSHLDNHSIDDLYANPLMLSLLGRVAKASARLPATRASLLEQVCRLIWPEHDEERQERNHDTITEEEALSAAGAIMAAMLFAGADVVSNASTNHLQDGEISLADVGKLPGAEKVQHIFASKLFVNVGTGKARPIHRIIAEYLGARWIAAHTVNGRLRRRLLASILESGAIPASLRGLHAWLAYHSEPLALDIIRTDPFGVLRYGETSALSASHAFALFDSLEQLAEIDPYFRNQDWQPHSAMGLLIPALEEKVRSTIATGSSNFHFRSLLIEGLKGAPLASKLADSLEHIVLSPIRFYRERHAAADALLSYRDRTWWERSITTLRDQGTEDSTRLAHELIDDLQCEVSDDTLISVLLAELGLTISPLPQSSDDRVHRIRNYKSLVEHLPAARIPSILDLLVKSTEYLLNVDPMSQRDIAGLGASLIVRLFDDGLLSAADATKVWTWLAVVKNADYFGNQEKQHLRERLDRSTELRRAIQSIAIAAKFPARTIWIAEIELRKLLVGLSQRPDDVTWHLEQFGTSDNRDPALRGAWLDLMRLGHGSEGFMPELREASRIFQRGDANLEAAVRRLENPKKSGWERRQEKMEEKRKKKERIAKEWRRRHFILYRDALRRGDLPQIINPAKCFLGLFADNDGEIEPEDRLAQWIGADLAADALIGFEAVLFRTDLPTASEISIGFAEGSNCYIASAIVCGLLCRLHSNSGFDDLPKEILISGLLLAYDGRCSGNRQGEDALAAILEKALFTMPSVRYEFAKLWIEPGLARRVDHVGGLYKLGHEQSWAEVAISLVPNWLVTFNDLPLNIELQLVDCLSKENGITSLVDLMRSRSNKKYDTEEQALSWFAIDFAVRFDEVQAEFPQMPINYPQLIWYFRNRMQSQRLGTLTFSSITQAKWIIEQFRHQWPNSTMRGSSSGDENSHDATDYIRAAITQIADQIDDEAIEMMQSLIDSTTDTYSDLIRHMAAEQRQKRAEKNYAPLMPNQLRSILSDSKPAQIDDLKAMVMEELTVVQKILLGDELDQVRDFWNDEGIPFTENRCRDRLAAMVGPALGFYGIHRITEADMPQTKRADLAFASGHMQLPMEIKGQWHDDVWNAATDQLDTKYLIDWRSEQRGIYCVLWFGDLPSNSGRRLKVPPSKFIIPASAEEMRRQLVQTIPEAKRHRIDVVVLDFTAGGPV
jgi:hypothetical protein